MAEFETLEIEDTCMALRPHAVCVPSPAQSHVHSMLKLAKLLHVNSFHITFIHSESNYNTIIKTYGVSSLKGLDDFCFETVPDRLPPDKSVHQDIESLVNSAQTTRVIPFRNLLIRLNDHPLSGVPPVSCIISDSFCSYTLEVAKEFNIPDFFYCPISACGYMGFIHYKELIDRGITPLKSESDLSNGYLDTPVEWIPGLKNIRMRDLPSFIRTTDPDDTYLNLLKREGQKAFEATAIIINTFDELEDEVLSAMASMLPPLYTIGPLSLLYNQFPVSEATSIIGSSFLKEDEDCLEWLDEKESGSVLYVNFGSLVVVSNEQMIEFAWGLANSKHDFLWIIRPDLVKGEAAVLPEEWLDKIKGRGLLASWCPQERVLSHPSVRGFLTHSGWNSTMESMSAVKPMICWPYFADQQTNCRYVCNEWGIGMELDSEVKREQVEELIVELMDGEKGKEIKKKVVEWKEKARRATQEGGSSFMNFKRVVNDLLLCNNKH
ncbi:7-deoxyloganetin glucosyltransferase-like isoform X2 [Dioscorea cayenensis subsp. rotundata]|uniref:Glycosyltransferase n=1 Tax=Dioscorea cayennensis subsp. rotundata TaxID=55577 RepID=A0AB40AHZ9_DIOCR|nr:7-deoxyloganetin glucosyltransferase-like isoform X2 [Dioscorea cayenensis subsp. rotundata]XP_039113897.1 7-deoxyloganetin glucosyltransferase-like isoform X2 [Dioscorea cayenensis subsp. rotundata]